MLLWIFTVGLGWGGDLPIDAPPPAIPECSTEDASARWTAPPRYWTGFAAGWKRMHRPSELGAWVLPPGPGAEPTPGLRLRGGTIDGPRSESRADTVHGSVAWVAPATPETSWCRVRFALESTEPESNERPAPLSLPKIEGAAPILAGFWVRQSPTRPSGAPDGADRIEALEVALVEDADGWSVQAGVVATCRGGFICSLPRRSKDHRAELDVYVAWRPNVAAASTEEITRTISWTETSTCPDLADASSLPLLAFSWRNEPPARPQLHRVQFGAPNSGQATCYAGRGPAAHAGSREDRGTTTMRLVRGPAIDGEKGLVHGDASTACFRRVDGTLPQRCAPLP